MASAPGRGAIGVVRVSGALAPRIAEAVLGGVPVPRHAALRDFRGGDGGSIDSGIALYFPAPHSFTGEDVLELHGHGGPVVLDLLLGRLLALGARMAQPGEFSQRAFLNGKLDLAQAEAVADLIDSASAEAARSARRSLEGAFSARIRGLLERLVELRAWVEAAIDFPDDEVDFLADEEVSGRLAAIDEALRETRAAARQGCLLREGLTVVIAGRPNVGKSSLLNLLAGREVAIVTDVPGTTRDLLRERILLDGMPLHVVDTAGLRMTDDPVERIGVDRAREALEAADAALVLVDDRRGAGAEEQRILSGLPEGLPVLLVRNKIDLSGADAALVEDARGARLRISAKTGAGLDLLCGELKRLAGLQPGGEGTFSARRRHLDALDRTVAALGAAAVQLHTHRAGELLAEELRRAQQALGEITGEFTTEDLLERIFSGFCIGK